MAPGDTDRALYVPRGSGNYVERHATRLHVPFAMATRPRPRPRVRRAETEDRANQGPDDVFFFAKRARTADARETTGGMIEEADASGPTRRNRKALSFDWVAQVPRKEVAQPLSSTNTIPEEAAPHDRSVSLSPPPPELEQEAQTYARQAIEQVTNTQRDRLRALEATTGLVDDPSSDTSLELNADLAQFYRGHDAHRLRERAIEREMERQRSAQDEREWVSYEDRAEPTQVYEVLDSSDDERVFRDPTASTPPSPPPPPDAEDTAGTLLLMLRGARHLEVQVRVRPTTQVHTMLAHFVHTHTHALSQEEKASIYMTFEGERLDLHTSVEELDVEDDDLLDVMW